MSADLDKAIDRAVREMLDVEPPADLRDRVMARLTASGARLPAAGSRLPAAGVRRPALGFRLPASLREPVASGFSRNRALIMGGAAAAMLLAVFVARRGEPVSTPAPVVAQAPDTRLPARPVPAPAVEPHVDIARETPPPASTTALRTIAAASFDHADASVAIEPLKTIAPIAVAPLTQEAITPADISPRPLVAIAEMQIAPLTPPDRR